MEFSDLEMKVNGTTAYQHKAEAFILTSRYMFS
jgi:hypothetical protein